MAFAFEKLIVYQKAITFANEICTLTRHNEKPKPFVWNATADEIFENLGRLCHRISDSGR